MKQAGKIRHSSRVKPARARKKPAVRQASDTDFLPVTVRLQREQIQALQRQVKELQAELHARTLAAQRQVDPNPVAGMVLTRSGLIREANAAATRLLGVPGDQLRFRALRLFVPRENVGALEQYLVRCLKMTDEQAPIELELQIQRPGGETIPVRLVSIIDRSEGEAVIRMALVDLSEWKLSRQWAALQEGSFEKLIEGVDGIVWETELPSGYMFVSRQIEPILGYRREQCMNNPQFWREHIYIDDRERVMQARSAAMLRDGLDVIEYRMHTADGRLVWLRDSVVVTRLEGGRVRLRGLAVNVTPLKEAQEMLRQANERLAGTAEERRRKLEETVRSIEMFCYGIAHELRAPMRAMAGFSELLRGEMGEGSARAREYAERIARAAAYADRLISDLLAYGRLHHYELIMVGVDMNAIVAGVVKMLAADIETQHARIEVHPRLPRVRGHPMLLTQVVQNLISNALKFVRPGERPRVSIYPGEQTLQTVTICVQDNGVGIPYDHQERVFGIFQRAHKAEEYPGTGMGLAIVKRAVEQMNGRVGVSSSPERGARFWIELPRPERRTRALSDETTPPIRPPSQSELRL